MATAIEQDDIFGPNVRGYFDFTILFEQALLSILPAAVLVIIAPFRVIVLLRSPIASRAGWLLPLKLVFTTL
jgi:ATP-binding cassette, subfamily C (CFTR/MRP), member 1